jgi:hypothetical protein
MPFKSEKQRRFLWAEHPEIAKRWAKEYPESNKGLPMYAKEDKKPESKEKAAHLDVLRLIAPYVNTRTNLNNTSIHSILDESVKNSEDQLIKVKVPHSDQPTYAGQEREHGEIHGEHPAMADAAGENTHVEKKKPENAINSLLQKISVVLSQSMAQLAENRKAEQEAREPQFQPQNQGIRQYSAPTPVVPPPMGSPQAQAQQPQPQQAQPAQSPQGTGMNSPSANPIQSFGPLSASGNINGNAAFGQKNSPDSLKTSAAGNDFLAKVMGMDYSGLPDPEDLDYDEEYMKTSASSPAWQRSAGKNDEGGLNAKGRASYNKATGGHLKAPVTEKHPKGKAKARRHSFCSRMCGMKKHETGSATAHDPDSRINKSLRKWNCKCSSDLASMPMTAHYGKNYSGGFDKYAAEIQAQDAFHMTPTTPVSFGQYVAQAMKQANDPTKPGLGEQIGGAIGSGVGGTAGLIGAGLTANPEKIMHGLNGGVHSPEHLSKYLDPSKWDAPGIGKNFADDVAHWSNMQGMKYVGQTLGNKIAPGLMKGPSIATTLRNLAAKAIVPMSKTTAGRVALGLGSLAPMALGTGLGMGAGRAAGGAVGRQLDTPPVAPVAK